MALPCRGPSHRHHVPNERSRPETPRAVFNPAKRISGYKGPLVPRPARPSGFSCFLSLGEGGIRTHDGLESPFTPAFPRCLRLTERVGFEPTTGHHTLHACFSSLPASDGEGGIRTHEGLLHPYALSKRAPSAARTPLPASRKTILPRKAVRGASSCPEEAPEELGR